MDNIIKNKKGNTGYHVIPWNFSFARKMVEGEWVPAINEHRVKEGEMFEFMVQQVTIHSCGKKVMRMQSMERGVMQTHRAEYNPETPIYTTREAAVEAAHDKFNSNPESVNRFCIVVDDPYAAPKA